MSEHDEQVAVVEYCDLKGYPDVTHTARYTPKGVKRVQVGDKYGRLTVIEILPQSKVRCVCDCGKEIITRKSRVKSGRSKSCGCYKKDLQRKLTTKRNTSHGQSKTRLYAIWNGINQRCRNPHVKAYPRYGGRGIEVCDEWHDDFMSFKRWADSNGYADNLTIDRIDVNGNYEPSNCRWITQAEQMYNTRRSRMITFRGETKCLAEWARDTGISRDNIKNRLDLLGWSVDDALTKEVVHR